MSKRDLFVVVADLDAENAIKTLLHDRQEALQIRLDFNPERHPQGDLLRYSGRDSGCYKDAVDVLRTPQNTHWHALLIFDLDGCGAEGKSRVEIERLGLGCSLNWRQKWACVVAKTRHLPSCAAHCCTGSAGMLRIHNNYVLDRDSVPL